ISVGTELCGHYGNEASFEADGRSMSMKEWLRYEWARSGIPLYMTNKACGDINSATRKYFTYGSLILSLVCGSPRGTFSYRSGGRSQSSRSRCCTLVRGVSKT